MDPKVTAFYNEILRVMRTNPDNPNIQLEIKQGPKYITIGERLQRPANTNVVNTVTRIDRQTLDVYSASGSKVRGNLNDPQGGFDLISMYGIRVRRI